MVESYVVFALMLVAAATAVGVLAWNLRRRSHILSGGTSERDFDLSRYRPMQRLLAADDAIFLAQAGIDARTAKRIRSERRLLLRRYLANLEMDFARLHGFARELLLAAPEDRPDLAGVILRQQIEFQRCLWAVKLGIYVPGFSVASAQLGRLLELAQDMRASARVMQVRPAMNAA